MESHRALALLLIVAGFLIFFFAPNTENHNVCVSDCVFDTKIWTTWGGAPQYAALVGFSSYPLVGFLIMLVGVVLLVLPHILPGSIKLP